MSPVVAIVGRPNVGKSTLFNRLTRSRQDIVDDLPGVTRDRLFGEVRHAGRRFTVVDTGGFAPAGDEDFSDAVHAQIELAVEAADAVVCLLDGRAGLIPDDQEVVNRLRRFAGPVLYAVNKVDGPEQEWRVDDFWRLGVDDLVGVSAAHGYGVREVLRFLTENLPEERPEDDEEEPARIRVAIVGRPNVGKSSLVNQLVGAPRMVVSEVPGTTRDTADTDVEHDGVAYTLMDTAGLRRRSKVSQRLERFSVIRAVKALDRCHVAVLLIDPTAEVAEQDQRIGRFISERGRGCVIAVNKWDLVEGDEAARSRLLDEVRYRLRWLSYAPLVTMSALTGKRVHRLLPQVAGVYGQFNSRTTTGVLNRILHRAAAEHPAGLVRGRTIKFTYINQSVTRPPTFVVFTNFPDKIRADYKRYLERRLREELGLDLTPIRIIFKARSGGK
ncbi:MAG: ribosome biogenesis GTPase Der [Proteobacteria bacterium]|nr:ribosome biogenesis GTPase Der [Pseudomonadota bacterium]